MPTMSKFVKSNLSSVFAASQSKLPCKRSKSSIKMVLNTARHFCYSSNSRGLKCGWIALLGDLALALLICLVYTNSVVYSFSMCKPLKIPPRMHQKSPFSDQKWTNFLEMTLKIGTCELTVCVQIEPQIESGVMIRIWISQYIHWIHSTMVRWNTNRIGCSLINN